MPMSVLRSGLKWIVATPSMMLIKNEMTRETAEIAFQVQIGESIACPDVDTVLPGLFGGKQGDSKQVVKPHCGMEADAVGMGVCVLALVYPVQLKFMRFRNLPVGVVFVRFSEEKRSRWGEALRQI